jgi:hypothetical protein
LLARDTFSRSLRNKWGATNTGQTWSVSGGSAAFSVSGGKGVISLKHADSRQATLSTVVGTTTVATAVVSVAKKPSKASISTTILGRQIGTAFYGARLRISAKGKVDLLALRNESQLGKTRKLASSYKAGKAYYVKIQTSGTYPTTIKVKAWASGKKEPSKWAIVTTDATVALQAAGVVGVNAYLGSAAKASDRVRIDSFRLTAGPA